MSTASATEAPRQVRFARRSTRGVLLGLSKLRLLVLGTAVAIVVGAFAASAGGSRAVGVTFPVWAGLIASAMVPVGGRFAVEWAPTVAVHGFRAVTGQTRWRTRPLAARVAGELALPGEAARLRLVTDVDGSAFVLDPHHKLLTAIARVRPGPFVLLDTAEQAHRAIGWGRVLAGLCQQPGVHRIQVLQRSLPDSGLAVTTWFEQHGRPEVAPSWATQAYAELLDEAATACARHETLVTLTISLTTLARSVRDQGGGMTGAAAVLRSRARALESALGAADLVVDSWLDPSKLAWSLRTAYDPPSAVDLDRSPSVGRDVSAAGPVAVQEHWTHLVTESAVHQTLWMSEWPRTAVSDGFLLPLVRTDGVVRSFSIVLEPIPTAQALRDVRAEQVGYDSDAIESAKIGRMESGLTRREREDVARREEELVSGAGDLRFAGLVTVSAADADALAAAVDETRLAAISAGCELRVLAGDQAAAFTAAALPLGRGI